MNGIFALGHFCETHGPSVILCTQALSELHKEQPPHILTVPWCNACKSIGLNDAYVSKYENSTYISVRTSLKQELAFLLKQACIRSLSCEQETNKDGGTVYFGDSERGHVLSYTFRLPDSLARGFHRLFTIILLMKDKVHLLNSWPFVMGHLKKITEHLQVHAFEINKQEQNECSQRVLRLSQGAPTGQPRSLIELTGLPKIFPQIHVWFTWILLAATKETSESTQILPEFSPWIEKTDENGFSFVEISMKTSEKQKSGSILREILKKTDLEKLKIIFYNILIGNQIIIRGPEESATKILNALTILLPRKWVRKVDYADDYIKSESCNFLGCGLHTAVPSVSENILRVDILNEEYFVKWSGNLPEKVPTLLAKMMKSIENELIQDDVLESQITVFVEEWANIAQASRWSQENKNHPEKLSNLMKSLGIQQWDMKMIQIWTKQINLYSK